MNADQLRHILRAAARITGEREFIRELLKARLINRGRLERLIDAEENTQLRETLARHWIVATKGTTL